MTEFERKILKTAVSGLVLLMRVIIENDDPVTRVQASDVLEELECLNKQWPK